MKIKKDILIVIFLLFPMIKPSEDAIAILTGENIAHLLIRILSIWDYLSIGISIIWLLVKCKNKSYTIKWYVKIAWALSVIFAFSTLREYSFDIRYICRTLGNLILIVSIANIYSGKRFLNFLKGCYFYTTLISFVNALSIYIFFPDGMYIENYYLYGLDNIGFIVALHAFFIGVICNIVEKGKIKKRLILLYIFIFGAYIYTKSGTGISMSIAILIFIMLYKTRLIKIITYDRLLICICLIFISIIFIQNIGIWSWVSTLLGKGLGFNGRTIIWTAMFEVLPQHWLLGFGIDPTVTQYYISLHPSGGWLQAIGHMHNIILEFLFRGGIVGLSLFAILWIKCRKKMRYYASQLLTRILCVNFLFSMVTCMFEFRISMYTFWLLPICLYEIDAFYMSSYKQIYTKY